MGHKKTSCVSKLISVLASAQGQGYTFVCSDMPHIRSPFSEDKEPLRSVQRARTSGLCMERANIKLRALYSTKITPSLEIVYMNDGMRAMRHMQLSAGEEITFPSLTGIVSPILKYSIRNIRFFPVLLTFLVAEYAWIMRTRTYNGRVHWSRMIALIFQAQSTPQGIWKAGPSEGERERETGLGLAGAKYF